jgi:hypothetical protein
LNSRTAASWLASTSDPSIAIKYAFTGPWCPINEARGDHGVVKNRLAPGRRAAGGG